jgi:hypothetical protein
MSEEMWQVVVRVPMRIGDAQRDALFNRVADAAHDWEPDDRDGWDVDVAGCKAEAEGLLPAVFGYELGQRDIDLLLWLHAEARQLNDWYLRTGQLQLRWLDETLDERNKAQAEAAAERSSRQAWAEEALRLQETAEADPWGCDECMEADPEKPLCDDCYRQFTFCACVSDEQAAQLGSGFARPVCAVHGTGASDA